jgi:ribonuclease E
MLINATQEEELRMAMVDGQRLYDLNIEAPASERKKANIYKGKITRIEPSLEAAFVDYGSSRHGFLPLKEISSEYYVKENKAGSKPNIKDLLKEGQDIVVQVDKEERGNKGAALTTFVSLAGRFVVLKPNKDRSGGVSRRITGEDRDLARKALNEIDLPENMSVILRTAGIDRAADELAWDLQNLMTVWTAILNVVRERPSPFLLYRESDSVVRALRDYMTDDIGEILIDDEATYTDAYKHVEQTMPQNLKRLKHYVDPVPLFTRFQIESQIESAFAQTVTLPSGGSLVIDHTEALVSIDINSARATKGGDIEATALNTNLEAADEIGRQLRIRDLGGLIVIDFIDMGPQKHQRDVENRLRDSVSQDRARVQIGKISRFGLLEMSRQRLRPSIGESAYKTCPRCTGFGTIRGTESLALAILRIIGEEARKERTAKVIAQLPVEVATYLLNEKRDWVQNLETRHATQVVLVANSHLETPHYDVRRVRDDQTDLAENMGASFTLVHAPVEPESPQAILERKGAEIAAVGTLKPSTPVPQHKEPAGPSLWARIVAFFTGGDSKKKSHQKREKNVSGNRGRRSQQADRQRSDSHSRSDGRTKKRKASGKKPGKQHNRAQSTADADQKPKSAQQPEQKPKQADSQTADESNNEPKKTRSRRSRGGRRRRRGAADKAEQATEGQSQSGESTATDQMAKEDGAGKDSPGIDNPGQDGSGDKVTKKARRPRRPTSQADAKPESTAETKATSTPQPATAPVEAISPAERTESKPTPEAQPAIAAESKAVIESQPKSVVEAQPTNTSEPKPAVESRPPVTTEPKPAVEARPEPRPQPRPVVDAKPEVAQESRPEPKPKPKPESESESESKAKPATPAIVEAAKPATRLLPWDES